jgi:hypothetical protein
MEPSLQFRTRLDLLSFSDAKRRSGLENRQIWLEQDIGRRSFREI